MTSYAAYHRREMLSALGTAAGYICTLVGMPVLIYVAAVGNEPIPRQSPPPPNLEASPETIDWLISTLKACPALVDDVKDVMADGRIFDGEAMRIATRQEELMADPMTALGCSHAPVVRRTTPTTD